MDARWVIVTSQYRDLFYGLITASDDDIGEKRVVRMERCRHIAYWEGPRGGITALAVEGPNGNSRIGRPVASALITGVAHVFDVSENARKRFEAVP